MQPSTGLTSLDKILNGIRPGDNIVWQVDSIDNYLAFVKPFCAYAKTKKEKLVYFRFAEHKELVLEEEGAEIHRLNPREGFETFITSIHKVIEQTGKGAYYVFDSFSAITLDYYSDRMIGNFFILSCPYLYQLETIAYFSIFRNYHSFHAAEPIKQTTQILIDVYRYKDKIYIHPLKVDKRYSGTMYMLHLWEMNDFIPIKDSSSTSDILASSTWPGLQSASYRMIGAWDRLFMHAEEMLVSYRNGLCSKEEIDKIFKHLLTLIISREEPILSLAEKYLTLSDIIYIWKRMIGTGMIGGKAVGMLLGRAILNKESPDLAGLLESHDSFFIGSDVFYSYLVYNNCWQMRQHQKNKETFLDGLEVVLKRILTGEFPDYIIKRFSDMLDYFGQSPIIVRSSSLLEDNFGNAFPGKYISIFCANQGDLQHRLQELLKAVRIIYASTMSEEALKYRAKRGVLELDEQMALLIQRVSGATYGNLFYPQLSGVAFSYNPYVWSESIDPHAGV
ncbi:MAG: PEP/pyruvate-binding domain-containing protein, partial [Candidatus Hydrogenedentota bacterium]